jgi:hypothetical protein
MISERAFRIQIKRVLEMTELSASQSENKNKIAARFDCQRKADLRPYPVAYLQPFSYLLAFGGG